MPYETQNWWCHCTHKNCMVSILKIRFRASEKERWSLRVLRLNLNPSESIWITLFSLSSRVCRLTISALTSDYMISLFPKTSIYHFGIALSLSAVPPRRNDTQRQWCVRNEPNRDSEWENSNLKLKLIVEMSRVRRISKYPRAMCVQHFNSQFRCVLKGVELVQCITWDAKVREFTVACVNLSHIVRKLAQFPCEYFD